MGTERTLSIIKPDAVSKNVIGEIYTRFEKAGLKVVAAKMTHLSLNQAEIFYGIHRDRPFFSDLVSFMVSGPIMVQVLEGENAIIKNSDIHLTAMIGSLDGKTKIYNQGEGSLKEFKEIALNVAKGIEEKGGRELL